MKGVAASHGLGVHMRGGAPISLFLDPSESEQVASHSCRDSWGHSLFHAFPTLTDCIPANRELKQAFPPSRGFLCSVWSW